MPALRGNAKESSSQSPDLVIDNHADLIDAATDQLADVSFNGAASVGDSLVFNEPEGLWEGGVPYWRDITSELFTRGGVSAPAATAFIGNVYQYEVVSNLTKTVFSNFHVNHDYTLGTKLYPRFHFAPTSNNSGVVKFTFEWTLAKGHGQTAFTATTTKELLFNIPANSAYKHFVAELPEVDAIPGTLVEPDTLILMVISRNGNDAGDTFPDSIWGATADIHYQATKFGTPNKAPNFYGD